MGYSCPVCGDPQADDEHLANHLAITAMIHGGDHEEFLDEHVSDWESLGETELGEIVREFAEDEEYPQVFEDTTDQHAHDHGHDDSVPPGADRFDGADLDDVPSDVLAEARELTRKRREEGADDQESEQRDDA